MAGFEPAACIKGRAGIEPTFNVCCPPVLTNRLTTQPDAKQSGNINIIHNNCLGPGESIYNCNRHSNRMLSAIKNILKQKQPVRPGVSPEEVRAMAAEAAKRAKQRIGGGQFGQVYEASPGFVVKEITLENKQNLLNEINTQARAAELGLAPKIQSASLDLPKIGDKVIPLEPGPNPKMRGDIVMQDLRENYNQAEVFTNQQQLDQAKQMARLSLNNISLGDRHSGNIMFNKTTGRPIQLDFGGTSILKNDRQKASNLSLSVAQGLHAAGLKEEALIFSGTVQDLLYTDPAMALDVAKQGLSRLQKIKAPITPDKYSYATVDNPQDFISFLGN